MSNIAIRDRLRTEFLEFTRTAFNMLPSFEKPSILDIGCGTGVQTIELANMCNGNITAIDIDREALEVLRKKVQRLGLLNRVLVIELSMLEFDSLGETYDVIWAEGSIFVVGFENGIRDWKQLLTNQGCLVIHDEDTEAITKLEIIEKHGYEILGQIRIPHHEWWKRYYQPLEKLLEQGKLDCAIKGAFRKEIDTFRKTQVGSIFFILQNRP
jgi:SAM-dependent methyltransferase